MPSKGVSALKFVGTASLGLLTGLSYTLSAVSIPSLLSIPTAPAASRALASLASYSRTHLRSLTALTSTAFLAAYVLSPRTLRHPYLLYVGVLAASSSLADQMVPLLPPAVLAPFVSSAPAQYAPAGTRVYTPPGSSSASSTHRMEQSYEMLGDAHSDGTSAAEEGDDNDATPAASTMLVNGEEVRADIDQFQRRSVVQTAVAGLGFMLAVVGIWGDGIAQVFESSETYVFEL